MLGLYSLASTALGGTPYIYVPQQDVTVAIRLPSLQVEGGFGYEIGCDLPSFTVSFTLLSQEYASGSLSLGHFEVAGTLLSGQGYTGSLTIPRVQVDGTIVNGHVLTGGTEIPSLQIAGVISQDNNYTGNVDMPSLVVSGVVTDTTDDSSTDLVYTGTSECLL
jgi:hypothetical protein